MAQLTVTHVVGIPLNSPVIVIVIIIIVVVVIVVVVVIIVVVDTVDDVDDELGGEDGAGEHAKDCL